MDLTDIQPGIITVPHPHSAITGVDIVCRFTGETTAERRHQLLRLWREVRGGSPDTIVTIGLTAGGLARLGVAAGLISYLPPEFVFGAESRREQLGDPVSDDEHRAAAIDPRADAIVMISSPSAADVVDTRRAVLGQLSASHATTPGSGGTAHAAAMDTSCVLSELPTSLRADRTEHFGFVDGIANPPMEGSGSPGPAVNGVRTHDGWRPVRAGEFIYGYPNESDILPGARIAHDLLRNGTFLVWRKIEQHLDRFEELAGSLSRAAGIATDEAAARLIGRRKDGTPLAHHRGIDDFDYANDDRVALQAHIRRSNPRTTPGFSDPRASFPLSDRLVGGRETYGGYHRILRRSMLWEKNGRVGTIFRCYQANIADQFEFVQRNWLNDGNAFRQGRAIDPVAGSGRAEAVVGGDGHEFAGEQPEFIDPRDHERLRLVNPTGTARNDSYADCTFRPLTTPLATLYAFVPGVRALLDIGAGRFDEQ